MKYQNNSDVIPIKPGQWRGEKKKNLEDTGS